MGGLALWVADRAQHHSILFTDSELEVYCRTDLKLTVSAVPFRFRLRDTLYFLTRNYYRPPGLVELLRV